MSVSDGNPKKYVKIIAKTSNGYSAVCARHPRLYRRADACEETRDLIQKAVIFHPEGMVEDGNPIPIPVSAAMDVDVQIP